MTHGWKSRRSKNTIPQNTNRNAIFTTLNGTTHTITHDNTHTKSKFLTVSNEFVQHEGTDRMFSTRRSMPTCYFTMVRWVLWQSSVIVDILILCFFYNHLQISWELCKLTPFGIEHSEGLGWGWGAEAAQQAQSDKYLSVYVTVSKLKCSKKEKKQKVNR